MRARRPLGFTLMELLVVLALTGVVTTIGATMFFRMMDYWSYTGDRLKLDKHAEYTFNLMRQDLADVIASDLSASPLRGIAGVARDPGRFWGFDLADDQLILPILMPTPGGYACGGVVKYAVDRAKGNTLTRAAALTTDALASAPATTVAEGVLKFRVEYAPAGANASWRSDWTENTLPRMLRVTLVLMDANHPTLQVTRQATFYVNVE